MFLSDDLWYTVTRLAFRCVYVCVTVCVCHCVCVSLIHFTPTTDGGLNAVTDS